MEKRKEKIGYGEGIKYYLQLQKNMLTDEERKKYIHFIQGYRIEDGRKMPGERTVPQSFAPIYKRAVICNSCTGDWRCKRPDIASGGNIFSN